MSSTIHFYPPKKKLYLEMLERVDEISHKAKIGYIYNVVGEIFVIEVL